MVVHKYSRRMFVIVLLTLTIIYPFSLFSPLRQSTSNFLPAGMDIRGMEEEDDCPELVPIDNPSAPATDQIPVTIITGYLGKGSA